jgi:pSer/pThr/pTyr-binding forkhead associated (FHA) protein
LAPYKNGFFVSKVENRVWDTICQEGRVVGTVTLTDMKELVFGRAPTCDVVLDHASISRQHARISCGASRKVRIQDMGSAHGTFVNGKRLRNEERQQIHGGDVLKFGASTRSYILLGDVT